MPIPCHVRYGNAGSHHALWRVTDPAHKGSNGDTYVVQLYACGRHLNRAVSFVAGSGNRPVTLTHV